MKKHFNKDFVMTKKNDEDFENSTKCWICGQKYVNGHGQVRDRCHITGKNRDIVYRDCNIKIKLNN